MPSRIRAAIHAAIRPAVRAAVRRAVRAVVRPAVRAAVGPAVRAAVRPVVRATVSPVARAAVRACAVTLLAAPLVSPVSWASTAAAAGPDWSAAPAAGGGGAPGAGDRPYIYLEGGPGAVLEDKLSVTNRSEHPRTVRLRGGDGARIALAERRVTVPPRTRADIPFTVTVPSDAVPGERPGAVMVSSGGREVAVRLRLRISGATLSALTVEDVTVQERGGGAAIRYALVNRGNTVLTPRLAVRADGLFGQVLRRGLRTLPVELPPGKRVRLTESWPDPPALDSVDVTLTVTAGGGAHATATAGYTAVPWWLLAPVATALVGAGGGVWLLRRRRRRPGTPRPQPQPEPQPQPQRTGAGATT
ncbi:hypothetical protein [Streptomyces sp. 5-10]|uniref:COG1470 family protein n=1 Tax=Streptomyces sp. 5-10 TaxID=878925 RepID=UPI00168AD8FC|nr:hypothetical protein [Streptomyces sp. 5-10]MBD3009317.1 hypothetical protein [Streptomyces sp. 5-10]